MTQTVPLFCARPSAPPARRARAVIALVGLATLLALGGCAAINTVHSDVSSFGAWPAGRVPGSFALDRLPSQQLAGEAQSALERGAVAALQQAGFQPASAGQPADVTVQIGGRVTRQQRSPWEDPLWWQAWGPRGNTLALYQSNWGQIWRLDRSEYQREVAVLIRDRASGQALYEARARTEGVTAGGQEVLDAMFAAALKDFPQVHPESHPVSVPLR